MQDPIEYPDEWGFIEAAPKIDKVSPKFISFRLFEILTLHYVKDHIRVEEFGLKFSRKCNFARGFWRIAFSAEFKT